MSFKAMYDGTCAANCSQRIHPGDEVTRDDDGLYWHVDCWNAPTPYELGPREVVCPDCFLVRPCRCIE